MASWRLEIVRYAFYVGFPVYLFWYFNRSEFTSKKVREDYEREMEHGIPMLVHWQDFTERYKDLEDKREKAEWEKKHEEILKKKYDKFSIKVDTT